MNIRDLKADELDKVTGGVVQIIYPVIGPAVPSPSPTASGPLGTNGADGGGGGGGKTYNNSPYGDVDLHHIK